MENCLFKAKHKRTLFPFFYGNLLRIYHNLLKLPLDIKHRTVRAHPRAAFKMENKASVIHIYGADRRYFIVGHKEL